MGLDLRLHPDSAIVRADPDRVLIVDLVRRRTDSVTRTRFCFLPFQPRAKVGSVAVDLFPVTGPDFRRASVADFSAARFSVAAGLICPANSDSGCFLIDFAIAPAGSAVAGFVFDLCRNCPAIVAGPGSVRLRRFVAGFFLSCFPVAAAVLVFVSDAVSIAQSSF